MTLAERKSKFRWPGFLTRLVPSSTVGQVESDVRELMKRCGDCAKEIEETKQAADEQRRKMLLEFISVADAIDNFTRDVRSDSGLSERQLNELEMLRKRFARAFERAGVNQVSIQLCETSLDATYHEVVRGEARDGIPEGTIVQVVRPGYVLRDRVLRPAQVIVAAPSC